jgi:hypothetical protein
MEDLKNCSELKCPEGDVRRWCGECKEFFFVKGIVHHKYCVHNPSRIRENGIDKCEKHGRRRGYKNTRN